MPWKFKDTLSLIKVSKGRCPKALDDYANFSVLYQVGRFTTVFCYQFLMIFIVLKYSRWTVLVSSTFIIPESRDIVQVMQTIQVDLQKFRFTAPGSNLALVFKNIAFQN